MLSGFPQINNNKKDFFKWKLSSLPFFNEEKWLDSSVYLDSSAQLGQSSLIFTPSWRRCVLGRTAHGHTSTLPSWLPVAAGNSLNRGVLPNRGFGPLLSVPLNYLVYFPGLQWCWCIANIIYHIILKIFSGRCLESVSVFTKLSWTS